MFEPTLIAMFLRTLGLVAPLVGVPGATLLANAAASLLEAGADGIARLKVLTEQMKARHDAGQTTTAEEILADVDRIKALDAQIQQSGRAKIGMLALVLGLALSVAAVAAPSMTFNVSTGNVVGLTWDCGPGATDASATGPAAWTGVKAVSGSATVGPITDTAVFGLKCNYSGKDFLTLTASAPTQNTDGSALTDFTGFKVYRGTTAANLTLQGTVPTTGALTYKDTGLAAGTYFYAVTAYNTAGVESARSVPPGSGTVTPTSSLTASVKITVPAPAGGTALN